MSDDRKPEPEATSAPVRMASSGLDLAVTVGGFAAIGWWLDRKYGWAPWGVLTGAILGVVGGLTNFLRIAFQATRAKPEPPREGWKKDAGAGEDGSDEGER